MEEVMTLFGTGIADIKDNCIDMVAVVLPYGLVVFGIIVTISISVMLFKKISGGEKQ